MEHEETKTRSFSILCLFLRFFVSSCSVKTYQFVFEWLLNVEDYAKKVVNTEQFFCLLHFLYFCFCKLLMQGAIKILHVVHIVYPGDAGHERHGRKHFAHRATHRLSAAEGEASGRHNLARQHALAADTFV